MKSLVKEYPGKNKKLYAAVMDLEKAYDRVDREALRSVLKIYGVGGQLLRGESAIGYYENMTYIDIEVKGLCTPSVCRLLNSKVFFFPANLNVPPSHF